MPRKQEEAPQGLRDYLIHPGEFLSISAEDKRILALVKKFVDSQEMGSIWKSIREKIQGARVRRQPNYKPGKDDPWAMDFVNQIDAAMMGTSTLQKLPQAAIDTVWDEVIGGLRVAGDLMTRYADDEALCPYAYDIYSAAVAASGERERERGDVGYPFGVRANVLIIQIIEHLNEQRQFAAVQHVQAKKAKRPEAIAFLRNANAQLKENDETSWYGELAVVASVLYDWEDLEEKTVRRYCQPFEDRGTKAD